MHRFESIYGMLEKPVVFGELRKVQSKLAQQNITFPLVEPTYYPTHRSMIISPSFPLVVKIGHHHAGFGKIKCDSKSRFDDVKSIVACHGDYCTAEEFIDYDYGPCFNFHSYFLLIISDFYKLNHVPNEQRFESRKLDHRSSALNGRV